MFAAPISKLPYSKEAIQNVIKMYMLASSQRGELTETWKSILEAGYGELAKFIEDEQVELVRNCMAKFLDIDKLKHDEILCKESLDQWFSSSEAPLKMLEKIDYERLVLLEEIRWFGSCLKDRGA